jgi:hypothetical protein
LVGQNQLFGWHRCPRDGLLEGKIRVVASPNVGNVRRGVAVTAESHLLGQRHTGIVGNRSQCKLAPAMIPEKIAVFDLGFFVQSLTKLRGKKTSRLVKILRQKDVI